MSAPQRIVTLVHASLLLSLFLINPVNAVAQHPARKRAAAKQEQPPPPPPPPPLPPTLEQLPAVPPKVTFNNGQLTIVAENSTLADVLRAVRTQTGAAVEIPSNATDRVVTHLGPGPARDVLASLLNGSHFNYVMLGSPTQADKVDRIILTSKSGGTPDASPVPAPPPGRGSAVSVPVDESENSAGDVSEQPVEDSADNSAQENQQQPNGQQQVKTPEQMLRELQQQQQQLQQQQDGTSTPRTPPPR